MDKEVEDKVDSTGTELHPQTPVKLTKPGVSPGT